MRVTFLAAIAAATLAAATATAQSEDPVHGLWKTAEGDEGGYLHVSIEVCGSAICGTIDNAFDETGDEILDYEHLGKQIVWDMIPEGDGSYQDGKVWAPDTDKTYKSKMQLDGDALTVSGCVLGGLICRGQSWTRIE